MLRTKTLTARLAIAVSLLLACAYGYADAGRPQTLLLTILHTNDIHGHLFPFDYDGCGTLERSVGGAARRATMIREIRRSAGHPVLVMDAGDVFTRGPVADLLGVPDFDVMNAVPYDIMTLGNNEFKGESGEKGLQVMLDRIHQAKCPVVCANAAYKATGEGLVPSHKVFDIGGVKVGVFGLTAGRVASYSQAKTLAIADPVATARRMAEELAKEADFIIALSHAGYPFDLQIAAAAPEIDVIVGGDSHTWIFQPQLVSAKRSGAPASWIGGTLVCQDGEWGRRLGRLDLTLAPGQGHRYYATAYAGQLLPVDSSVKAAEDIERILARHIKPYQRVIGTLTDDVPLQTAAAWVAERIRQAAGAQAAIVPYYTVESGLREGRVTELDTKALFPFTNNVVRLSVTGRQLLSFLSEQDCAYSGIQSKGDELYTGSRKIEDKATYALAVEDFFANSSPALAGAARHELGLTTRQVVEAFIAAQ